MTTPSTVARRQPWKLFLAAILVALLNGGCSPKGASQLSEADRYFSSGDYEKAEIEYKNALQAKKVLDPHAIGRLGIIYFQQGRLRQAVPYLLKARELNPDVIEVREKLAIIYGLSGKSKESHDEAEYILSHDPTNANAPLILVQASAASQVSATADEKRLLQLPEKTRESAAVLTALAAIELGRKNFTGAESLLKKALAQDPKFFSTHAVLAAFYGKTNQNEQAEVELRTAAQLAPPRSGTAIQYARFKIQRGDTAGARSVLENLAAKAPDFLPAQSMLAELAANEKRYDESTALVAKVLAKDPSNPEGVLLGARLKLVRREFVKVADDLEAFLKYYPKSPQALYFLGLAYIGSGERIKAIDRLTQCVNIAPTAEAVMALAGIYAKNGDVEAAALQLTSFVEKNPDLPQPNLMLANLYRGRGNFTEALAIYRQVEKKVPSNPQSSYEAGITLLQLKRPADAREAFNIALQRTPGFLPALEQLCALDVANKDLPSAIVRIEAELARDPNSAGAHLLAGRIFAEKHDVAKAESELKRTIELRPELAAGYLQLAKLYVSTSQQEKALGSLKNLTDRNPRDVSALLLSGLIYEQQKNYNSARDSYQKVLALDPKSSVALNNLAYLYCERLGDIEKAYELAQKARELLPDQPQTADTLGWVLFKKGQFERAQSLLDEAATAIPTEADVHFHLGATLYALGREEPARLSLERALELNRDSEFAADIRRRLLVISINPEISSDASVATLSEAIAASPDDSIALIRLGRMLERSGSRDSAISAYLAAAKASPRSAIPQLGLARLYVAAQETEKAFEAAKMARKLAPGDAEIARTLGAIADQIGERSWGASLLQEASRKKPDDPNLLYDTALAVYRLGQIATARDYMGQAIEQAEKPRQGLSINQKNGNWEHLTDASRFLEMTKLAITPELSTYDKVVALVNSNHDDIPALMAYGRLLEVKRGMGEAVRIYQQVLTVAPEFTPAKLRLAVLSAGQNRPDVKAQEWAQQARTAYPSDPEAARTLGILVELNGGDATRAMSLIKESLVTTPDDSESLYYLARAQLRTNEKTEGRANLQRALSRGLRDELSIDAKALLKK